MYSASRYGISAYASVGLETGVLAASPHKLILMLFEGVRIALASALVHMKNGEITAKGEAISKAIIIITSGLQASLQVKAGGELGERLNALYDYMSCRLLEANFWTELWQASRSRRERMDQRTRWQPRCKAN